MCGAWDGVETAERVEEWEWGCVHVVVVEEREREWIGFVVSIRRAAERVVVGETGGERRCVVVIEKRRVRFVHRPRFARE